MRRHLLLVLAALFFPLCTVAQTGFPPFGSFQSTGFDAVNQQNLNAIFVIPISSIPGRGQSFQYNLANNSLLWTQTTVAPITWTPVTDATGSPTWGWNYGPALAGEGQILLQITSHTCRYIDPNTGMQAFAPYSFYSNFRYRDWVGTVHPFAGAYTVASQNAQTYCGIQTTTYSGYSTDNSGFYIYASQSSTYVLSPAGVNAGGAPVDTNGNYISQTVHSNETDWTDTAGHLALKAIKNSTNTQYEWQDSSGNYTAASTTTVQLSALSIKTNFACSGVGEYTGTASLPTEIDLPNGQKYLLTYEPTPSNSGYYTGRIKRVTLPTGGYYEYDYPTTAGDGIVCADASVNSLTRVMNDGTNTSTWTFSRAPSGSNWVTAVTAPQMPYDTAANNSVYTFNSSAQQITAQFYQGAVLSANLKRTVNTAWTGGAPATQITILENGHTQNEVETSYDTYGNLLTLKEHDWGTNLPGSILRTTTWTYLNSSPYISANILNRPTRVTVADSGGTIRSRTDAAYDESGYINSTCITGAPQHNDSNFGCSFTTRGDPTTVTTYTNPAGGTGPVTSHNYYDDLGNLTKVTDPNNNPTSYVYASTFGYAYPTTVTNALNQSNTSNYNSYTGRLISSTDPNNQQTTYTYDSMLRLSQVNYPDGGQTAWTFTGATSITTTTKMNSSQNILTTALLDGLGRYKENQLNSDPEGVVYQDTTYDPLGRVYTASNPYRTTSDATYGITTYRYDTLGRIISVTLQDGSVTTAAYATNTATVTDPASKKRQTGIDGLGRLTQVTEDPGGLGYVTSYTYDALNNPMSVVQNSSRQRTYTYDALSRLVCESNPEIQIATCPYPDNGSYTAGTIRYTYDNNSNLTSRIAPLQNQTGTSTVTTTYSYDTLNRLTQKSYSDGTPLSAYAYDQTAPWGWTVQNPIGRLTNVGTYNGSWNTGEVFSFDPVGRKIVDEQCAPATCPTLNYTYDLGGDTTSYTNGMGVTFTQSVDTSGRPTQLTSTYVDAYHPATLVTIDPSVGYYPHGAIRKMAFGNGLTQAISVEPRLQPCRINLNSSGLSVTDGCNDGSISGTIQDFDYAYGTWGSTNNGNVTIMDAGPAQSFGRTYSYDSLNRLSTLSSPSDPNGCTGLSWTYDAWGNRTDQTVTGGSCHTFHQTFNTQNRLIGPPYLYDAAGNMTYDGTHTYTFDAESRLIQVDGTVGTCSTATACYTYDAIGRRVEKATGSTKHDYFYDLSSNVIDEWCTNCSGYTGWSFGYVYFDGALAAEYGGSTYFVHGDHLGSTRLLTGVGSDLISNPGFESGLTGWSILDGNVSLISNASNAHSGTDYIQISTAPGNSSDIMVSSPTAVQPGDQVTFGGWAYLQSGGGGAEGWWIETQDANHNAVNYIQAGSPATAATWTFQSTTYTVPTGVAYVALYATAYMPSSAAVLRVDDGFLYNNRTSLQIVQNLDYLPYGELNSTDSGISTHEFTGDEQDAETALAHTLFRQYSSSIDRWMTPDPAGLAAVDATDPQSWNRYSYVLSDPMDFVDTLGLQATKKYECSNMDPLGLGCNVAGNGGGGGSCNDISAPSFSPYIGGAICNVGSTSLGFWSVGCWDLSDDATCGGAPGLGATDPGSGGGGGGVGQALGANGCILSIFNPSCKRPACISVMLDTASENDVLPPLPAGVGYHDLATSTASTIAITHIVQNGLVVPLRSSIVRGILAAGETAATAAVAIPLAIQSSIGLAAEYKARQNRTCRTAWESN
jgi:RHS repeat-associated protein